MDERPKLSDPKEFDIIRKVHLLDRTPINEGEDVDPDEWRDRQEHKRKAINHAR